MALSLRNIFMQVQDDISEVDESIKRECSSNEDHERKNYEMKKSSNRNKVSACEECAETKESQYAF